MEEEENDDLRYVEHLQKQLLTEGYEEFFNHDRIKKQVLDDLPRLRKLAEQNPNVDAEEFIEELRQTIENFEPKTQFETHNAKQLFEPLVDDVTELAKQFRMHLSEKIEIMTAPSASITPASWPASGGHKIFIGIGTSSFCNYWSKSFSLITAELAKNNPKSKFQPQDFKRLVMSKPNVLMLPTFLAIHYAIYDTLIGFGIVDTIPEQLGYRWEILKAMEIFIVAHEFTHCYAADHWPEYQAAPLPIDDVIELEHKCDAYGFLITTLYGGNQGNLSAFSGAGPVLFFRALRLSLEVRSLIVDSYVPDYGDHPDVSERINKIEDLARKSIHKDESWALEYLKEVNLIFDEVESAVKRMVSLMVKPTT